jgi:hypothetical protein
MAKIRIPSRLLESMEHYTLAPETTPQTHDAALIADVLIKHFADLETLENATIAAIDALNLTDAMVMSSLIQIDRS